MFPVELQPRKDLGFNLYRKRFKVVVKKTGCYEWQGSTNAKGYGLIRLNNKSFLIHRVYFETYKEDILPGNQVCHHCDNPKCVNPDHLFQGTAKDNNQDCNNKGRNPKVFTTGQPAHNAKLDQKKAGKIYLYLHDHPELSTTEIADKFKVSNQLVKDIKRGKSYINLVEEIPEKEY